MRLKIPLVFTLLSLFVSCFAANITQMEYYLDLDEDPAQPVTLSFTGDSLAVASAEIDLAGNIFGQHILSFRVKDEQNRWSHFAHRMIYYITAEAPALSTFKYRIDSLPAQSIPLNSMGENIWMLETEICFPEDTVPGLHSFYGWVLDAAGKTSFHTHRLISYVPTAQESNISRLAWFFSGNEADPQQIYYHDIAAIQQDITAELLLALPNLTPGATYTLNMMALQEDGTASLRATYSFIYDLTVENLIISLDGNQILLNWDEVPDALHYLVEIKDNPDAEGMWQEVPDNSFSTPANADQEFYRVKVVK